MCTAATARRRRRQAANDYRHLPAKRRPYFSKRSAEKSARIEARKIATEKRMKQKKS
jgi:hypothetical protein